MLDSLSGALLNRVPEGSYWSSVQNTAMAGRNLYLDGVL